jgi:hypothetical protein
MQKSGTSTARVVVGGTLVGLVTLVVAGRLLSSGLQPPAARPTPATTVPAASVPSTTAPVVPVVATVQVGAEPTQVAVGAGGDQRHGWVQRLDPRRNQVTLRSGPHRPRVPAPPGSAIWPPAPTRSGRALMASCCGWIPAAATWWPRSPGLLAPTTPTVRLGPARCGLGPGTAWRVSTLRPTAGWRPRRSRNWSAPGSRPAPMRSGCSAATCSYGSTRRGSQADHHPPPA